MKTIKQRIKNWTMQRIFASLLVVIMAICFAACPSEEPEPPLPPPAMSLINTKWIATNSNIIMTYYIDVWNDSLQDSVRTGIPIDIIEYLMDFKDKENVAIRYSLYREDTTVIVKDYGFQYTFDGNNKTGKMFFAEGGMTFNFKIEKDTATSEDIMICNDLGGVIFTKYTESKNAKLLFKNLAAQ